MNYKSIHMNKYRVLILAVLFMSCFECLGQFRCEDTAAVNKLRKVNNGIGFIPSKATVTNGLAVNWSYALDGYCDYRDSLQINGLYLNIGPFPAVVAGFSAPLLLFYVKEALRMDSVPETYTAKHQLNGLAIGLLEMGDDFSFRGLSVVATYQIYSEMRGVSISGLMSRSNVLNGVSVAGLNTQTGVGNGLQVALINSAVEIRGIQIGLSNSAYRMRGVQIGLWNRIGKRGLPLLNFSF